MSAERMTKEVAIAHLRKCLAHLGEHEDRPDLDGTAWTAVRPFVRYPTLLRYVLRDLLGFACLSWPGDKVRWSIRGTYRGMPVVLEDRKLGFYVGFYEAMPQAHRDELVRRLKGALHIVVKFLQGVSKQNFDAGLITIENNFRAHEGRYRYFRDRALERYDSEPPPTKHGFENGWEYWQGFAHIPELEGDYNCIAMVNEYFSRLEHILIHLLQAAPEFNPADGRLRGMIGSNWGEKFKTVFQLESDHDAKRIFDRLFELKESIRNLAHGGFQKDGGSAYVHYEKIGALPMNFFDHRGTADSVGKARYLEICALFDAIDDFLDHHHVIGFGMTAVRHNMDAQFDPKSLQEFRTWMLVSLKSGTKKHHDNYVDWRVGMAELHANYEG